LRFRLPSVPAGSFNSHDGRWAASSIFYRISARSMAQQTASGSWSVHRAAGADVDCVRHRSPVICSIARFIGHGSLVPAGDFGAAGGPSSRRSSYRCRRRFRLHRCVAAANRRPVWSA
jgi:hypothetical protein